MIKTTLKSDPSWSAIFSVNIFYRARLKFRERNTHFIYYDSRLSIILHFFKKFVTVENCPRASVDDMSANKRSDFCLKFQDKVTKFARVTEIGLRTNLVKNTSNCAMSAIVPEYHIKFCSLFMRKNYIFILGNCPR